MKIKFICVAPEKEDFNFKGEKMGTITPKRALFYYRPIGEDRIYRQVLDTNDGDMILHKFDTKEKAQELCDRVNEAYNDNFEVVELSN